MVDGKPNSSVWDEFWDGLSPASEIQMWDFYGGRPWILKHTPRYGKVLEAGCGLGRYVFYLSQMGIDIEGIDFHEPTVRATRQWGQKEGLQPTIHVGDVTRLPYDTESLSGYLSFGVIEHFQEGPSEALAEAFRVLRPGGIAIISTPSLSFAQAYFRLLRRAKDIVKRIIDLPIIPIKFFQYWYTPNQLFSFVEASGLKVVLYGACDLKYAFLELVPHSTRQILWFSIADFLERTPMVRWGAQALTVSVKMDEKMHCFLCGQKKVHSYHLKKYYLPICDVCSSLPIAKYYRKKYRPKFKGGWQYNPAPLSPKPSNQLCHFCEQPFQPDKLFEDYGFSVEICPECLRVPELNLVASNELLQPRWRPRHPTSNT